MGDVRMDGPVVDEQGRFNGADDDTMERYRRVTDRLGEALREHRARPRPSRFARITGAIIAYGLISLICAGIILLNLWAWSTVAGWFG